MKEIQFPKDFLMGSATAATQIEGGDTHNNWYHWSQMGKIANGASSITASDHYHRIDEDIRLMKELNQEIYRMSIEWSRIEPKEGVWSKEGIDHYRNELTKLKAANIKPLVTLHHFSHPQWFEELGAWTSENCLFFFKRYVRKVLEGIGDLVDEYCTINEPNVFVNDTYMDGNYPPGHKNDLVSYFKASKTLILAHLEVYKLIHHYRSHKGYTNTKVGFEHNLACLETGNNSIVAKVSKSLMHYSFHTLYLKGMVEGYLAFPLGNTYPLGKGCYCDFIGINYYSRHLIFPSLNPAMLFGKIEVDPSVNRSRLNDLGWEIYPEGLYHVVKDTYEKYPLPIYITENGIPDSTDRKRAKFIYDHLLFLRRLLDEGIGVERYYHWSLLDNLEWQDGYGPRFGLIHVNYETFERTIRPSGHFYSAVCKSKQITKELYEHYIQEATTD